NHTSGWLGDDVQDFGSTDDALARYVGSLSRLPQLNPPGAVFAYNNAGLAVAGRIIEVLTATSYEAAVQNLLLNPLQLGHTHFFDDQLAGLTVATP
ncbi:serine hydrolase, partial [Mycobacterium kansasii]